MASEDVDPIAEIKRDMAEIIRHMLFMWEYLKSEPYADLPAQRIIRDRQKELEALEHKIRLSLREVEGD